MKRILGIGRAFGEKAIEDAQKASTLASLTNSPRQYLAVEIYEQELRALLGSNGRPYRVDNRLVAQGHEGGGEIGGSLNRTDIVDFFKRARASDSLTDMSYAEIIYCLCSGNVEVF